MTLTPCNHVIRATVIGSSGGGALRAAMALWQSTGNRATWLVITDRPCGLLAWAHEQRHTAVQLPYENAHDFSRLALREIMRFDAPDTLLFYTRWVKPPLIEQARVCNIHPSCLPDFPGLHAVERAMQSGAPHLGATLHEVDEGLDTGPILAQRRVPWDRSWSLAQAERMSYTMKVWLTLWWCERLAMGPPTDSPPRLRLPHLAQAYERWQASLLRPDAAT